MRYGNFDEKDKDYYVEVFKIEAIQKLNFFKADVENHKKNIRKLEREIEEENVGMRASETEVAAIEAKLGDPDLEARKLLFRDFKGSINRILNGEESQMNARFGLRIEKRGPYLIEKPVAVSSEGKKHTEMRTARVMKIRDNESALEKFRTYLREGYNLPIDNLTFEQLKDAIEKFFNDAPKPDLYGPEYETETFVSPTVKVEDSLFRI